MEGGGRHEALNELHTALAAQVRDAFASLFGTRLTDEQANACTFTCCAQSCRSTHSCKDNLTTHKQTTLSSLF